MIHHHGYVLFAVVVLLVPVVISNMDYSLNHYQILGVPPTASAMEIKQAWKGLVLRYHPDKVAEAERDGAQEHFIQISTAYEALSDPQKRSQYDYERQQTTFSRPYHRPQYHQHRRRRQSSSSFSSMIGNTELIFLALAIMFIPRFLLPYLQNRPNKNASVRDSGNKSTTSCGTSTKQQRELQKQIQRYAPNVVEFKKEYCLLKGRRVLVFFFDSNHFSLAAEDWKIIQAASQLFCHDPLTFTWLDLSQHERWKVFLVREFPSFQRVPALVVNQFAKKMTPYLGELKLQSMQDWLSRLVGGEIPLRVPESTDVPLL